MAIGHCFDDLGEVLIPTGFKLQTNPDTVREPDVAFISHQRLEAAAPGRGFFQGSPLLDGFDVSEILQPAGCAFVSEKLRSAKIVRPLRAERSGRPPRPCLLEGDAVDDGHDVDAIRRHAQLHDLACLGKVFGCQPQPAEAKGFERVQNAAGIFRAGFNQHVEVFREARMSMKGKRVAPDDDRLNALRVEAREQFFEVARWAVH